MLWGYTLAVLCIVTLSSCDENEWRQVQTSQGPVRGRRDTDGGLYVFYNIPYATVPTGPDRYKAPLPAKAWLEPLEAVDKGIICMQGRSPLVDVQSKKMQEDCLVANVYVPETDEKDLPVIVYIHGGAYEIGFGNMITPKHLVRDKKVIVVNFNYRLGVHGFLCLGTKDVPGNAGMKDQVALLKWVTKNIASFGGNPDDITIAGYSAGSVSADLLMLSKSARGLFSKVILESGASVGSIAVQIDPLKNAREYAKRFNFTPVDDDYALEKFYKNTPFESLVQNTFFDRKDGSPLFSPCIEHQGSQTFLDDNPVNIIKKGEYEKVPILIGISNMEGLLQIANFARWKISMNERFSDFLPVDLKFKNEDEKDKIARKVKEFYFGDELIDEASVLSYVNYFGDILFAYPTLRNVKLHVEAGHNQIYLYEYSFVDDSTPAVPFTNTRGATHCAQTAAVLDGGGLGISDEKNLSKEYKEMKSKIREMWYNFAAQGKPVPEGSSLPTWSTAGANGGPYMSLGSSIEEGTVLLKERARFWEEIYQEHYREPVTPAKLQAEKHIEL